MTVVYLLRKYYYVKSSFLIHSLLPKIVLHFLNFSKWKGKEFVSFLGFERGFWSYKERDIEIRIIIIKNFIGDCAKREEMFWKSQSKFFQELFSKFSHHIIRKLILALQNLDKHTPMFCLLVFMLCF